MSKNISINLKIESDEDNEDVYPFLHISTILSDPCYLGEFFESILVLIAQDGIAQDGIYPKGGLVSDPIPSPGKTGIKEENVARPDIDMIVELIARPAAGSAEAASPSPASPSPAQKEKRKSGLKPKTEHVHYTTLVKGTLIRYTNPENQVFFGKAGTVILHRGAMVHLDFGKDGMCWGSRKYCEIVPGDKP